MKAYRHGDLLIISTKNIPKTAKKTENRVLLEGETTGHMHQLNDKATVYKQSDIPSKDNDYLIGYFETEEGALLTHQEHEVIELPKGIYRFHHQREYDEQEERAVID